MAVAVDNDRTTLQNTETLEYIAFPLTPQVVSTSVAVNYNAVKGVGAPQARLIYSDTGNETTELSFPYYRVGLAHGGGLSVERATQAMNYHRNFARSLTLPGTRTDGRSQGAPAVCLLVVPGVLAWTCRVTSLKVDTRVGEDGGLLELGLTIGFTEEWAGMMAAEDILTLGYARG